MAMPASVMETWELLDEDEKFETIDFMKYLMQKKRNVQVSGNGNFPLGCLTGGLMYISEDFDETPVEFEEYM